MADIAVQSACLQFLIRLTVGRPYLGGAKKATPVVTHQCNTDNHDAQNGQGVSDQTHDGRNPERRRICQPEPAEPPDNADMHQRETVIGKPVIRPQRKALLNAVSRQHRMRHAERRPGESVEYVLWNDGPPPLQEAFILAMVAVVLKPSTISARTTLPP